MNQRTDAEKRRSNRGEGNSCSLLPAFSLRLCASAFIFCLIAAGCAATKVTDPVASDLLRDNGDDAQIEFWHALAEKPLTSNDEAFHGLLLYTDGQDPATNYDQRVQTLKDRRMLPSGFSAAADDAVTRGDLAVAIVRILNIKGGLTMRVFGPSPRYAVRELTYETIYPPSSPQQTFSGAEFVGIIGRIEDYQRGDPADEPAKVLPGEMDKTVPVDRDYPGPNESADQ